jgi:3-isopropylmalate/(R)-2-methylmalate dehydratase small subunit
VRADGQVLPTEPIPGFLLDMVEAGGLMAQLQQRFSSRTSS